MAERLITIATFGESLQAEISKTKLEDEGIKCLLAEDPTHSLYGFAAGGIRLRVRESDAERALQILGLDE